MSWDTAACFKSMCVAFNDFQRLRNDQTMQDLQRQIDVILGVTSHGATLNEFTPNQLIYTETLSALVSLVNEPNLKTSLYLKSLLALSHLANDYDTKVSLQDNFNLASTLVGFVINHSITSANKQMILQAFMLLEKMTYGSSCNINNIYMVDLLKYLVKSIYITSSEFCIPSLAVLANLCRNNNDVKLFVKTMTDAKQFLKVLLSYLSNSNKVLSITSLSIMASLYLHESLGENMFNGQNLVNMTRLAFKVVISNDDITTRNYAIDLIIDFIRCENSLKIICDTFESDILKILNLLHSTDAKTVTKIFNLLIEFCKQPCLRRKVTNAFFKDFRFDFGIADQEIFMPAQSLLHWISHAETEDIAIQANLLSIVYLKEMIAEIISSKTLLSQLTSYISHVLHIILPYIKIDVDNLSQDKVVKHKLRKITVVFDLLICMFENSGLKDVLAGQLNIIDIVNIIDKVLVTFSDDLKTYRDSVVTCCKEITLLVFKGLEVISGIKHCFESGLEKYSAIIQNPKLIPLISQGLLSDSKYHVHASLQIIGEGLKVKEFHLKALADILLSHNTVRVNDQITKVEQKNEQPLQLSQPLKDITNSTNKNLQHDTAGIAMLSEKLKNNLDMNDVKISDIMDFYEHKLSALMGRESHIQDLLEAKSSTLVQTERLLAQYRCRHAQSDAECLKLRSMLQTSERKNEADSVKITNHIKTIEKMEQNITSLHHEIKRLQSVATEHEELKLRFEEKNLKLENVEVRLKSVQEEFSSLQTTNDCLLKNTEILNTELVAANNSIQKMEQEKQRLLVQIQEKDKESKNLKKMLTESKSKVASLEGNVKELEASLGEKENSISQLHVELEKQCQISAMIHNLTMGKINISNPQSTTK